jgi:hypothetical protein
VKKRGRDARATSSREPVELVGHYTGFIQTSSPRPSY